MFPVLEFGFLCVGYKLAVSVSGFPMKAGRKFMDIMKPLTHSLQLFVFIITKHHPHHPAE